MNKVYTYPQKIFKSLAALAVIFGVTSCATSQSTAASSGETDGIYYSPSKDGQVQYVSNETPQDYEIKVGGAYFDANGNGAEEFYYEEAAPETQEVNVYTGGSNSYVVSGSTDWGRYDGVDITINNWGWNDPFWGMGYNSWGWGGMGIGWGMGWNNWGWRGMGWHNPYWGWGYGGGWGYGMGWNNWGWGGYPYGGFYGGYYGGFYGNGYYGNGHYYRNRVQSGVRPGSNLAYTPFNNTGRNGNVRGTNSYSQRNSGIRPTRSGNVRNENNAGVRSSQSNVRPVRSEQPVRNNNNILAESGVRPTRTEGNVRPVRATVPNEVRQNNNPVRTNNNPVRTNNNPVRSNNNQIRTTEPNRNVSPQRNNTPIRSNQGISPSRGSSNSGGIRSGGGSPSRGSGGGGGVRSGGGRR